MFRTTGDNEIIDKSLYYSHATSNITDATTFIVQTTIQADTPSQGVLRAVKRDTNGVAVNEDQYQYQSWFGNTFHQPMELHCFVISMLLTPRMLHLSMKLLLVQVLRYENCYLCS